MYIKLAAAVAISAAAFALGIIRAREEKRVLRSLFELCAMLEQMKNEIYTHRVPIKSIISSMRLNSFKAISDFIIELDITLDELGTRPFSDIWAQCAESKLSFLPFDAENAVSSLGSTIGRSDASMQAEAIDRCISILSSEYEARKSSIDNSRKMYVGLYGGAGLILSIILL